MDGTKVRANAANDRTYDDEALRRLLKRSERTICDLEAQNEAGEDAAPGICRRNWPGGKRCESGCVGRR